MIRADRYRQKRTLARKSNTLVEKCIKRGETSLGWDKTGVWPQLFLAKHPSQTNFC